MRFLAASLVLLLALLWLSGVAFGIALAQWWRGDE